MLKLTGKCCGGIEAIEFMESLAEIIDEDDRTEEFCAEYEKALKEGKREILIEKSSMQIQSDRIIVYKNMMLK